jgi:hypothetical protein
VSNFSQGLTTGILRAAADIQLRHYRDGIRWQQAETEQGVFRFGLDRVNYPADLAQAGAELVMVINWGNPLYDAGMTPHSPEALAAMGRFVAAMVARYPAITTVEVGNEFNGANFVNGPVRDAGLAERGRYHLAMVRAVADAVRAVRPEVRILGGSTHSMAAGYLWPVLDAADPGLIDALAIHPYTTPIDQLAAQFAVLRRHPGAPAMPVEITEWGTTDRADAADHLIRGYAALASLGVSSLYWFPLNDRGDGFVPLIERDRSITNAGRAFRYAQQRLVQRTARDVSPDPFTRAYLFGEDTLVIWGEPRPVTLRTAGLVARNAEGEALSGPLALSPSRALVIEATGPLALDRDVVLGCSALVADTFYQFTYDGAGQPNAAAGFRSHAEIGGARLPWLTEPGQQRAGVPWTPYLSVAPARNMRLDAETMRIEGNASGAARVIHEYRSPAPAAFQLEVRFDQSGANAGSLAVLVENGSQTIPIGQNQARVSWEGPVMLAADAPLRVSVGPGGGRAPRALSYRLRLHDPARCSPS